MQGTQVLSPPTFFSLKATQVGLVLSPKPLLQGVSNYPSWANSSHPMGWGRTMDEANRKEALLFFLLSQELH